MTKKTIIIISAISLFCLVGGSVLAFSQFQNSQKVSQNNSQDSSQNNSKLSNQISSSSSQDSQIKPLVADATHDVVVLEECDLAVRFNKKFKLGKDQDNYSKKEYFYFTDEEKLLYISCNGANIKGISSNEGNTDQKYTYKEKKLSPSLNNLLKNDIKFGFSRAGVNSGECLGFSYKFENQNRSYEIIDTIAPKPLSCSLNESLFNGKNFLTELFGKYGEDYIQIQQNSLAPSTPSIKL